MRAAVLVVVVAALAAVSLSAVQAFYIPGVSPVSYSPLQNLSIKVNSMTSSQGVMPFPFYSIKTCMPSVQRLKDERKKENLGEILWGDQIEPSEYFVQVVKNSSCAAVCAPLTYTKPEAQLLQKRIEQHYRGNMVLDNLPVAQETHAGKRFPKLLVGFPLGTPAKLAAGGKTVVHNHLLFRIVYNEGATPQFDDLDVYSIVGFFVEAYSIDWSSAPDELNTCKPDGPALALEKFKALTIDPENLENYQISWTYSVVWEENADLAWATRWDIYMRGGENDDRIHWISIINSLLVVLFLSAMVAMIMLRTLHRDFSRYNDPEAREEAQEETGWKMVHGDVFRTPANPILLSALIGSGAQLIGMALITLAFACMGFLSPSNRGALQTASVLLFVILGAYSGYVSARLLKFFKRQNWRNVFFAGMLLPGTCIAVYLTLNTVQWAKHASSAVPIKTLLLVFALWFFVSLPLVLVGASFGYRRPVIEVPVLVNALPRFIPDPRWYLQRSVVIMAAGVLPFGAGFIELVFILSSFWQGRIYYVFGFFAVVLLIIVVTCAEVAIVMVYFQLCYDDYHWWWRSFLLTASSGVYLFSYSVYYLITVLTIRQPSSLVLYLGYMYLISMLFGLFCGTIGFYAAFKFVRKIYASIKID